MKKITLLAILLATSIVCSFAQTQQPESSRDYANYPYWIEMMQDQDANYFETVKAFNSYWENREITKGSGYNPFKRWEWHMATKINPDGSRLPSTYERDAYNTFVSNSASRSGFDGDWINLGPIHLPSSPNEFWGNGRLNAIGFHPADKDIFYVGSPSGGLWVTETRGQSWDILTDDQPTLGVSSIVVDKDDPDVIYIGTGDRDAADAPGLGVFKSSDAGETWEEKNNGMGNVTVGRMIQDPDDGAIIYAATNGGIYKSNDAAENWSYKIGGNMKEIVFKPGDPSVLYASASGRFYRSTDSGDSWQQISTGLPVNAARAVIGVTEANPEYVYFMATNQQSFYGLYRSTDGGGTFSMQSNSPNIMGWACNGGSGGQAWYDLDVTVDPMNEETIWAGGVNCWKSIDGGVNWVMSSNQVGSCSAYPVHADLHVLEWNPVDGRLYVGNDGGIWWTDDNGVTWNRVTDGLAIGQQYKLGQSRIVNEHVTTGYQDNGISNYTSDGWVQSDMYADGMESQFDHTDASLGYGCMQYGRMMRMIDNKFQRYIAGEGIGGITESGAWVTPFTQHVNDQNVMFIGYNHLWRTRELLNLQPYFNNISSNVNGGQIRIVEHSMADDNVFYFATSTGRLIRSDNINDDAPTWTDLSSSLPASSLPTDVTAHAQNPLIVYMTQGTNVYRSEDKGSSWENLTGNLPTVSLNDIAYYDRGGDEALYVGSNIGVFFKDNTMDDWILFSEGLPASIEITEIEIFQDAADPSQDMIRASSYGRGLWESSPCYTEPTANFFTIDTLIPLGCSIDFTDASSGYPESWQWTFEGGTPNSSTEVSPKNILYDKEGIYEVSLTVSNLAGNDTKTKTGYIEVVEGMLPEVEFTSNQTAFCSPGTVEFYDESQGCPTSWLWEIEPDTYAFWAGTDENTQNPIVKFYDTAPYTVKLTVANSFGNSSETKVDYIEAGGYVPYTRETFENGPLSMTGWTIENPDSYITWELFEVGGTSPGSTAAGVNISEYQSLGERDRLISPPYNLENMESAWLEFNHAYAKRHDNYTDSLIVLISGDCGASWTRVYAGGEDGSGNFATHEQTENFWPETVTDWCMAGWGTSCISINMDQWTGQTEVKVAFETYAYFGNPIMIDNVAISQFVGETEVASNRDEILIYPNPANHSLNVVMPENGNFERVELVNHLGQTVFSKNVSSQKRIQIKRGENWTNGIYYLRASGNKNVITKKVLLF